MFLSCSAFCLNVIDRVAAEDSEAKAAEQLARKMSTLNDGGQQKLPTHRTKRNFRKYFGLHKIKINNFTFTFSIHWKIIRFILIINYVSNPNRGRRCSSQSERRPVGQYGTGRLSVACAKGRSWHWRPLVRQDFLFLADGHLGRAGRFDFAGKSRHLWL